MQDAGVVDVIHNAGGVAVAAADTAGAGAGASAATTAVACDDDDDDVPCYLARMVPSPGRFPTLRFAVAGYRVSTFRIRSLVANLFRMDNALAVNINSAIRRSRYSVSQGRSGIRRDNRCCVLFDMCCCCMPNRVVLCCQPGFMYGSCLMCPSVSEASEWSCAVDAVLV